jgi:uncharacterized protein YhbP (UPF0306 family)
VTVRYIRKRFPESQIRRSILGILRENTLCSMATVAPGNRAHINTAYFCYSAQLELYFLSDPEAQHCKNLERNPSLAMTIFSSSQKWGNPDRGLQLFGTCRRVDGRPAEEAAHWYGTRFPAFGKWLKGASDADRRQAALLRSYAFHRFLPKRIKILDEREFGGGVFVTAIVKRGRQATSPRRSPRLIWHATHLLAPSESVRATSRE